MSEPSRSEGDQSPEFVRMSLAAALTLGFKRGLFYRNARLHCINLLLTYPQGCLAKCAYCGLSGTRSGAFSGKSFIRVQWPTYSLEETIERISQRRDRVKRMCISMITRRRELMTEAFAAGAKLGPSPRWLIMFGHREDILTTDSVSRFIRTLPKLPPDRGRLALYPQSHHMMLRDLQARILYDDIAAWMRNPGGKLPSGADESP